MGLSVEAARRYSRQIALPEVGSEGQARILASDIMLAGEDLATETAGLYLAAAGVSRLPRIGGKDWPKTGTAWVERLQGASLVVRSGFDDDQMLKASIYLGVPVVVMRASPQGVEVIAFRRQGPCVHTSLMVPPRKRETSPEDASASVVAGTLAATEALWILVHPMAPPRARHLRKLVPAEALNWQDPVPQASHPLLDTADIVALKACVLASGLSVPQLVSTAWASESTFRGSHRRGGANGARIRLALQKDWAVNQPAALAGVLSAPEAIQKYFNAAQAEGKAISLADLIVLAGGAAVEAAAKLGGIDVTVPFSPGRTDASQSQTDVASFAVLEPAADGFRNHGSAGLEGAAAELLVDRANLCRR